MEVAAFLHSQTVYVTPTDTLARVAMRMAGSGLGCLAVLNGETVVGVITQRDLVKAMALSQRPTAARAGDYMHDGDMTARASDDQVGALLKMLAMGCLDLPVVDRGRLVGTVSARELLAADSRLQRVAI